jgi:hypothetical protein
MKPYDQPAPSRRDFLRMSKLSPEEQLDAKCERERLYAERFIGRPRYEDKALAYWLMAMAVLVIAGIVAAVAWLFGFHP